MSKHKKIVLLFFFAGCISSFIMIKIFESINPLNPENIDNHKQYIRSLEISNDSLRSISVIKEIKNDMLQHKNDSLMQVIKSGDGKVVNYEKNRDEKIKSISPMYSNQLYNFWTRAHTDSTFAR